MPVTCYAEGGWGESFFPSTCISFKIKAIIQSRFSILQGRSKPELLPLPRKGSFSLSLSWLGRVPKRISHCQEMEVAHFEDNILTRVSLHLRDPQLSVSSLLREPVIGILLGEMFQTNQLTPPAEFNSTVLRPSSVSVHEWITGLMSFANNHRYNTLGNPPYPFSLNNISAESCNNPLGPSKISACVCEV